MKSYAPTVVLTANTTTPYTLVNDTTLNTILIVFPSAVSGTVKLTHTRDGSVGDIRTWVLNNSTTIQADFPANYALLAADILTFDLTGIMVGANAFMTLGFDQVGGPLLTVASGVAVTMNV